MKVAAAQDVRIYLRTLGVQGIPVNVHTCQFVGAQAHVRVSVRVSSPVSACVRVCKTCKCPYVRSPLIEMSKYCSFQNLPVSVRSTFLSWHRT